MKRILAILMLLLIVTLFASNFTALLATEGPKKQESISYRRIHIASPKTKIAKSILEKKEPAEKIAISYREDTLKIHKATWYRTDRHSKVHREHPTAAYNFVPKGTMLLITNTENGKSCVVEVTDRMGNKSPNKIDLSHKAFGMLESHSRGFIIVTIRTYEDPKEEKSTNNQI